MSAERLRGDFGPSLVVADYPRHDAPGTPKLQGIPGKDRNEYFWPIVCGNSKLMESPPPSEMDRWSES
ncbi:MAG: hypothetical protein DMG55_00750 [Acidobacteria bacterium]|nr:MAG: hypothetical protein DMG55_00750 [Acidobacteriota bacterium]